MEETPRVNVDELRNYVATIFEKLSVSAEDAAVTADNLVSADLRGIESHGVARLPRYVGGVMQGIIRPRAEVTVVHETPATALIDGGNGLGQPAGKFAMQYCIKKAKESGAAFAAVRNSNHYGIAGYYAMMALDQDLIGISLTNSAPLVVPTYGVELLIGTNPISVAVPTGETRPFLLDMATSTVPRGKIEVYDRKGLTMPEGWAVDEEGQPATDPARVLKGMVDRTGGGLLPLGGSAEFSGYKGYGLALLVDILSGVLPGAKWGSHVGETVDGKMAPHNVGHFFGVIDVNGFRPLAAFRATMDEMINELKNSKKAMGEERIYIAGEKEWEMTERHERDGVPLYHTVVEQIQQIGKQLGLEPMPTL